MNNNDKRRFLMLQMNWHNFIKLAGMLLLLSVVGCSSNPNPNFVNYLDNHSNPAMVKKIKEQYQVWYNAPYRYGGNSLKGVDCSGLVMNFYDKKLRIAIPRVTAEQAKIGRDVSQLVAGDLVFFKTGQGKTGLHVGIYYQKGLFLHVSSAKGVILSSMEEQYWKKHYWTAKRVVS